MNCLVLMQIQEWLFSNDNRLEQFEYINDSIILQSKYNSMLQNKQLCRTNNNNISFIIKNQKIQNPQSIMQSDENNYSNITQNNICSIKQPSDIFIKQSTQQFHNPSLTITQSQPLLLLQQRQVVKHMLLVGDWTILAIYTPSDNMMFVKQRQKRSMMDKKQDRKLQYSREEQDHVRFLAVYAVRSGEEGNKQGGTREGSQWGSIGGGKVGVEEIRLLQKECRVQGIKQWRGLAGLGNRGEGNSSSKVDNSDRLTNRSNNNSTNANNNNNRNQSTTIPTLSAFPPGPTRHFLILSYTRLLLYTITPDHTITLTRSFTTDFIIPYNILLLQPPNQPNTDDFMLALTGVDRRQTFWSGYWEIQEKKRAVYLVKDGRGLVGGKGKGSREKGMGNTNSVSQRSNGNNRISMLGNSISSSRNNNSNNNNNNNNNNNSNNKLRRVKSAQNIFTPSFTTQHYTKPLPPHPLPTSPSSTTNYTQDSEDRLEQYRQKVPVMFEEKDDGYKESCGDNGSEWGSVRTDRAVCNGGSSKNYNIKNNNSSNNISTTTISYSHCLQLFPNLFPVQHSHHHHPPLTHLHHFYLQTNHQSTTTSSHQLLLLVGYLNLVTLINVNKNQIVSKVVLQHERTITTMLQINNIFGLATVIITLSSTKKNPQHKNKLIKVTVDIINQRKLGLGLEPVKVNLQNSEEIVQVDRLGVGEGLGEGEDIEREMKESFEVVMSLIGGRGKGKDEGVGDRLMVGDQSDGIRESIQGIDQKEDHHQYKANQPQGTQTKTWLNIRLQDLPYHVILLTSTSRILLYNHITTLTQPLYTQQARSSCITSLHPWHLHHSQLRLSLLCQKTILPELTSSQSLHNTEILEHQCLTSHAIIQELKEIRLTAGK